MLMRFHSTAGQIEYDMVTAPSGWREHYSLLFFKPLAQLKKHWIRSIAQFTLSRLPQGAIEEVTRMKPHAVKSV